MKLPMPERRGALTFNLTPMIDVVFNLIIFFLAASHMANAEGTSAVTLPIASSGRDDTVETPQRLVITLPATGGYLLGERAIPLADLLVMLDLRAAQRETLQQFEVRLRVDRQTPYRHLQPILMACARRGIRQVRLAVLPPAE